MSLRGAKFAADAPRAETPEQQAGLLSDVDAKVIRLRVEHPLQL
jgi:hypothetical protein